MTNKARTPHGFGQSCLYMITTKRKLAERLGLTLPQLQKLISMGDALYREFEIKKPGKKPRKVEEPSADLKKIQGDLARYLTRIQPPDYLYCPVKGRSYITNAAVHRNSRVVKTWDVKKYFPNTPSRRVTWFFREVMKCSPDVARLLTRLATYKGHLPTGSPLSPVMAHYAFYDVWQKIARLCKDEGCVNTVYVDDLTVSGQVVPGTLKWKVRQTIHSTGLRYHKEKSFIDKAAEVTGTVLRDGKILMPNRQHKKLWLANKELRVVKDEKARVKLKKRIRGLNAQASQFRKANKQVNPS